MKIINKSINHKFLKITDRPCLNTNLDWDSLGALEVYGEVVWDDENQSIWNLSLDSKTAYLFFLCQLVELVYDFICDLTPRKIYTNFCRLVYRDSYYEEPTMCFLNFIDDKNYIALFPDELDKIPLPAETYAESEKYGGKLLNLEMKDSIVEFEKIYDYDVSNGFIDKKKRLYKYTPEELIKKVLLCFEENLIDVPFDSKLYHGDNFQNIIAKANEIRQNAESIGIVAPLSEDEKRPKYKVVPVEEAKL